MPSGDWESVTVPSDLLDKLDEHREDNGGREPYWEVIEMLADAYEDPTDGELEERVGRLEESIEDLPARVSERLQTDLR